MNEAHPLATMLLDAANGRLPPADGAVEVIPSPPGPCDAVVAFTAHHIVAANVDRGDVMHRVPVDDLGSPMRAPFLAWLGAQLGTEPGMLDIVLVPARDPGDPPLKLVPRSDLLDHPRLARSRLYRRDLRVFTDPDERALVLVGRGLAGRWELGIEVAADHRNQGLGRELILAAPSLVPEGEPLFAQVSPGNVASLRAFIAAGYRPIGAEVLFLKR